MPRPLNAAWLDGPPGEPGKPGPPGPTGPSAVADPHDYGAAGDGVTDDTAAVQAALDTGRAVMLRAECTYLVWGLTMLPRQTLIGNGATIRRPDETAARISPKGAPVVDLEWSGRVPVMDSAGLTAGDTVLFESAAGDTLAAPFTVTATTPRTVTVEPAGTLVTPAPDTDTPDPARLVAAMPAPARVVTITPLLTVAAGGRVEHLTVDGNAAGQTWTGPGVGELSVAGDGVTLEAVTFTSTAGAAVVAEWVADLTVSRCRFTNCWAAFNGRGLARARILAATITDCPRAVTVTGGPDPAVANTTDLSILDTTISQAATIGVNIDDGDNTLISRCRIDNSAAVRVIGPNVRNITNVRLFECRLVTTSLQYTRVTNAEIRDSSLDGISAAFVASGLSFDVNACRGVTVDGCRIDGRGQAAYGVRFRSTTGVYVCDTEITGSAAEGIFTDTATPAPTFDRNRITACNGIGIRADSTTGPVTVTGNTVSGCGWDGIAAGAAGGRIIGNYCDGNNRRGLNAGVYSAGIRVVAGSWLIASNTCTDTQTTKTQQWGVQANVTSTRVRMVGNVLDGNAAAGLNPMNAQVVTDPARRVSATVGTTQVAVAHGLGYTPRVVHLLPTSNGNVWQSAAADATNVYLTADAAGRTADVWIG